MKWIQTILFSEVMEESFCWEGQDKEKEEWPSKTTDKKLGKDKKSSQE